METLADNSLVFLDHAKERMKQRGITPQEVGEAIEGASADTAGKPSGKIRLAGSTASGRPLSIIRLEHFPVIVSVVSLESPTG